MSNFFVFGLGAGQTTPGSTPGGGVIGSCASAADAASPATTRPAAIASATFILISPLLSRSRDRQDADHSGLLVALDSADERVLARRRELDGERRALPRLEHRRPAAAAAEREVVRQLAVVLEVEHDRSAGNGRLAELEAHLEQRDVHVRRLWRDGSRPRDGEGQILACLVVTRLVTDQHVLPGREVPRQALGRAGSEGRDLANGTSLACPLTLHLQQVVVPLGADDDEVVLLLSGVPDEEAQLRH